MRRRLTEETDVHLATELTDVPTGVTDAHQSWWRLVMAEFVVKAVQVDGSHALNLAGRQGAVLSDVGPDDVLALELPTVGRAMLSARANWEAFGHPPMAIFKTPDGEAWILICDLRPCLAELARVKAQLAPVQEEEK